MTLKEKQELLYKEWISKRDYKLFVKDGILNYKKWETTKPKILFLLKESADNFTEIANQDIRIHTGNGNHFWWQICYWKYIINKLHSKEKVVFIPTKQLPESLNENRLDSIAYVNVKKLCENKTTSKEKDILQYADVDKILLKKQIDLIQPNVVFCSTTTFKAYKKIYPQNNLKELNKICYKDGQKLVLKFRHPSYFQIKGGRKTNFTDLHQSLLEKNGILNQFDW